MSGLSICSCCLLTDWYADRNNLRNNLFRLCGGQEPGPKPAAFQPGLEQQPHAAVTVVLPGARAAPGSTVWHKPVAKQSCADFPVSQQLADPALPAGAAAQVSGCL